MEQGVKRGRSRAGISRNKSEAQELKQENRIPLYDDGLGGFRAIVNALIFTGVILALSWGMIELIRAATGRG